MPVEIGCKVVEQIKGLEPYLSERSREELAQILKYGEEIKARGEEKKREWWKKDYKYKFERLLRYKWNNEEEIEKNYEYLGKLNKIEKEKFIEEYLHDDMLYSGKFDEEIKRKKCSYNGWKEGNSVIGVGTDLFFYHNHIGDEGAKTIAENIKLKEFVVLNLGENEIGDEGAKAIAENMELKEGVGLKLHRNHIGVEGVSALSKMELKQGVTFVLSENQLGDEGAKEVAENMKLKEGVYLNLGHNGIGDGGVSELAKMELKNGVYLNLGNNQIGDKGVEAIMKNMELKDGCTLHLLGNHISEGMKNKLKEWKQSYVSRGIKCEVKL